MLLAELEVFHSRPFSPTRRVALGRSHLPVDPPPGFGGVLVGGVVAAHAAGLDPDLLTEVDRLAHDVEHGYRLVQPRARHRFQADRHGLASSHHRLVGDGEGVGFEFEVHGTPIAQVLGAVYAAEALAPPARHSVARAVRRALRWHGPLGPSFVAAMTGGPARVRTAAGLVDPTGWALGVLGFDASAANPSRTEVVARFRARLREAHPDHGGDTLVAGHRIQDLTEARRILLGS